MSDVKSEKHTPTPWNIEGTEIVTLTNKNNGETTETEFFSVCIPAFAGGGVALIKNAANADFIVQACNSHDTLVDRLIECQEFLIGYHAAEENNMRRRILGEIIVKNAEAIKLAGTA